MSNKETPDTTPGKTVEFQPDALEIKNSKLPLAVRLCIWFPFVVIVAAIVWASIAEVDIVVNAHGKVVTTKPTITMKPYDRVFIKRVLVKVGDIVEKGQVLIQFDPTIHNADVERLQNDINIYQAQYNRFKAEFLGEDYVINVDRFGNKRRPTQIEMEQRVIFEQRRDHFIAKVESFDSSISYYQASLKTKRDSLETQKQQLVIVDDLWQKFKALEKNNAVSWKEYAQTTISKIDMEDKVATLKNNIDEMQYQEKNAAASRKAFIQEWKDSISENMVAVYSKLVTAQQQYAQAKKLSQYTEVVSPCRAEVHELAAISENSATREAEPLLTLVPIDDNMMIEAELRPMDIAKVHVGSEARVKLDSYPFQKHGTLDGIVIGISENTFQHEARAISPEASPTYYRAQLSYYGKLRKVPDTFRMIPGMEVQVEIIAGRRKVITYVIYPLIKSLDVAMREP